jgi:hypothetical protein
MNLNHTKLNLRFLGEANFEYEVLQSKRTVLVAFCLEHPGGGKRVRSSREIRKETD